MMIDNDNLEGLEPLGWIHTQSQDQKVLNSFDLFNHSRYMKNLKGWLPEQCIAITCAFTPGSCTLGSYKVSKEGLEWADKLTTPTGEDKGFEKGFSEQVTMLLSDKYMGFFLVPDEGSWNYNFMGIKFVKNMKYDLKLDIPKEFYNEIHRPAHFLDFTVSERGGNNLDIEVDDNFK